MEIIIHAVLQYIMTYKCMMELSPRTLQPIMYIHTNPCLDNDVQQRTSYSHRVHTGNLHMQQGQIQTVKYIMTLYVQQMSVHDTSRWVRSL